MMSDEQTLQPIKYRVIGALVIVATFMLAWWLLLDHDVKRFRSIKEPIPEPIMIERFEVTEISKQASTKAEPEKIKEKPAVKTEIAKTEPVKTEKAEKTVTETKAEPAVEKAPVQKTAKALSKHDSQGLPEAWVLQVASFSDKENAKQLQQKLYKADFPAYVKTFNVAESQVYRVLVGPKLSKHQAAEMAKAIEKQFALKSMLMLFKTGYEQ